MQSPESDLDLMEMLRNLDHSGTWSPAGTQNPLLGSSSANQATHTLRFQPSMGDAGGANVGATNGQPFELLGQSYQPVVPLGSNGLSTWPPRDLSMDPDPPAEPLMEAGMDISGSVLFDSKLLNMIQFN